MKSWDVDQTQVFHLAHHSDRKNVLATELQSQELEGAIEIHTASVQPV
jgi:hypothetical protein